MVNKPIQTFIASIAALSLFGLAVPAQAAPPKPKKFLNCADLNKIYPHGVARKGARDEVKGKTKPVTAFTVQPATYTLNKASDRDKDGIACEKR
jgi:excalibur calcium-binding domain-containing protein